MTGHEDIAPLPVTATSEEKIKHYNHVIAEILQVLEELPEEFKEHTSNSLLTYFVDQTSSDLQGEDDWVASMATVASLLHSAFEYYHWTGFYQAGSSGDETLIIGPYQGHLGCLRIPFNRGVCGAAARSKNTQLVPDVSQFPGYIACACSTQSEIVVPVVEAGSGRLRAVLDVDSDISAAFTQVDQEQLERLCTWLGEQRVFWKGER